jgi:hypothetical protein
MCLLRRAYRYCERKINNKIAIAIGAAIDNDITQVNANVTKTRLEFLCFEYLIGCVTAINLEEEKKKSI